MRDTEKIRFDDFSFHNKMYTYLFDLPTLFAYLECQFCFPFSDFSCFSYLNAIHAYRENYPFYAFLRTHMVYRSQWKWPSPGHQHNECQLPTRGVLNFHFGIVVRPERSGTKNKGLKN